MSSVFVCVEENKKRSVIQATIWRHTRLDSQTREDIK